MDKALKAAVYGRCRRDLTQTSGVGLYAHSASIGLYARSLVEMVTQNPDWTCVGMYIDEDQDWKAYERLREDADKGLFDAVILRDLAVQGHLADLSLRANLPAPFRVEGIQRVDYLPHGCCRKYSSVDAAFDEIGLKADDCAVFRFVGREKAHESGQVMVASVLRDVWVGHSVFLPFFLGKDLP